MKMVEKEILNEVEELIRPIESDCKIFISSRKAKNYGEYCAVITIVVPIGSGEEILHALFEKAPDYEFKGSSVDATDDRGVDVLDFEMEIHYRDFEDNEE